MELMMLACSFVGCVYMKSNVVDLAERCLGTTTGGPGDNKIRTCP
jgi:hypothetical protein